VGVENNHESVKTTWLVLRHNDASCDTVPDCTACKSTGVMNLKLHHKLVQYRKSSFFKELKGKVTIKKF